MKLKLKKDAAKLESWGSHQGFPKNIWNQLNNGETVEFDRIPSDAAGQVEEVSSATTKSTTKTSSTKGGK